MRAHAHSHMRPPQASIGTMLVVMIALCVAALIEVGSYGDPLARTVGGLVGVAGGAVSITGITAVVRPRRWVLNAFCCSSSLVLALWQRHCE